MRYVTATMSPILIFSGLSAPARAQSVEAPHWPESEQEESGQEESGQQEEPAHEGASRSRNVAPPESPARRGPQRRSTDASRASDTRSSSLAAPARDHLPNTTSAPAAEGNGCLPWEIAIKFSNEEGLWGGVENDSEADVGSDWVLVNRKGGRAQPIPGTVCVAPSGAYGIRGTVTHKDAKGRARRAPAAADFAGWQAEGKNRAEILPPVGSKLGGALTFLGGVAATAVGVGVYYSGNTQKCGYGKKTDKEGKTTYELEVKGTCKSAAVPPPYMPGTGEDLGKSAKANAKAGIVVGALGVATMAAGATWWLFSRGSYSVSFSGDGPPPSSAPVVGIRATPSSLGLEGTW